MVVKIKDIRDKAFLFSVFVLFGLFIGCAAPFTEELHYTEIDGGKKSCTIRGSNWYPSTISILTARGSRPFFLRRRLFVSGEEVQPAEFVKRMELELASQEKTLGRDHPVVSDTLNLLAEVFHAYDKYSDADPLYKRALAIREKAYGPEHKEVSMILDSLAALYFDQGKCADAEALYKRALPILEKALGPDHHKVSNIRTNLEFLHERRP